MEEYVYTVVESWSFEDSTMGNTVIAFKSIDSAIKYYMMRISANIEEAANNWASQAEYDEVPEEESIGNFDEWTIYIKNNPDYGVHISMQRTTVYN